MSAFRDVVQRHEKHLFDIDRKAAPAPGNNRCQIDAAAHGIPSAGERTNPWRPPCNVVPRFVMVTLDGAAAEDVVFTVEASGRELVEVTVAAGASFARVDVDDAIGFGAAEAMQVVATTPGSGWTSGTISTVIDCPSQWFLSGTLIFPGVFTPAEPTFLYHAPPT